MDHGGAVVTQAEDAAFTLVEGDPACGIVLICDHAENRVPPEYGDLGLPPAEFKRHIAYDPGAAAVTRGLAAALGAPAVLSTFSRLLIDPNRGDDDPTLIMRLSDGAVLPGNAHVDEAERARRIARFYRPYHDAIDQVLDAALATGIVPAVFSVHSFTPVWRGVPRPWHAGILWDLDPRLAVPVIDALRADTALIVGDNEPYAGALRNDTMYQHATARGLAHALIEIRQDLIADDAGVAAWTARVAGILQILNRDPAIHRVEHHGSKADEGRAASVQPEIARAG
jgi:predicted N-formylglutamate amidohydrolase